MSFFCPLPWIHQFIQLGGIKMCCVSHKVHNLTPSEFDQSDFIKDVRSTIRAGGVPADCTNCLDLEKRGFNSVRTGVLRDFNYTVNTVPNQIEYLDLRHSNLCNFSCRTCNPQFSTSINHEVAGNNKLKSITT